MTQIVAWNLNNMKEFKKELIERLEKTINETPSGDLRNLLTDVNILIQSEEEKPEDIWDAKIQTHIKKAIADHKTKYHYKNKPYKIFTETKVKINGEWIDCTIYLTLYDNEDGWIWVRTTDEFTNLFKISEFEDDNLK